VGEVFEVEDGLRKAVLKGTMANWIGLLAVSAVILNSETIRLYLTCELTYLCGAKSLTKTSA
jgi:hypothetical protein